MTAKIGNAELWDGRGRNTRASIRMHPPLPLGCRSSAVKREAIDGGLMEEASSVKLGYAGRYSMARDGPAVVNRQQSKAVPVGSARAACAGCQVDMIQANDQSQVWVTQIGGKHKGCTWI